MKLTLDQMLLKAATVATRAHDGHKRKDGTPYISHPIRVAIRCETPEQKIVALLHDVVEDTDVSADDLREMGFTNEIVEAILSVTKIPGQTYREFIRRANRNEIGRVVKVRDIEDNLEDQSALDPDEAAFLTKRYTEALRELELPGRG